MAKTKRTDRKTLTCIFRVQVACALGPKEKHWVHVGVTEDYTVKMINCECTADQADAIERLGSPTCQGAVRKLREAIATNKEHDSSAMKHKLQAIFGNVISCGSIIDRSRTLHRDRNDKEPAAKVSSLYDRLATKFAAQASGLDLMVRTDPKTSVAEMFLCDRWALREDRRGNLVAMRSNGRNGGNWTVPVNEFGTNCLKHAISEVSTVVDDRKCKVCKRGKKGSKWPTKATKAHLASPRHMKACTDAVYRGISAISRKPRF